MLDIDAVASLCWPVRMGVSSYRNCSSAMIEIIAMDT